MKGYLRYSLAYLRCAGDNSVSLLGIDLSESVTGDQVNCIKQQQIVYNNIILLEDAQILLILWTQFRCRSKIFL